MLTKLLDKRIEIYIDEENSRYIKIPDDMSISTFLTPHLLEWNEEEFIKTREEIVFPNNETED